MAMNMKTQYTTKVSCTSSTSMNYCRYKATLGNIQNVIGTLYDLNVYEDIYNKISKWYIIIIIMKNVQLPNVDSKLPAQAGSIVSTNENSHS